MARTFTGRFARAAAGAAVAAVMASIPLSAAASPSEDPPVAEGELEFTGASTFTYGEGWVLGFKGIYAFGDYYSSQPTVVELVGGPPGYRVGRTAVSNVDPEGMTGYAYPENPQAPLDAGTYVVKLTASALYGYPEETQYRGSDEISLTIEKAKLTPQTRATLDPSNPGVWVLSGQLTGDFASNYYPTAEPYAPLSPAGTWTFRVTDSSGADVFESSVERTAGDHSLGASVAFTGAEAQSQYTVTAEFSPSGGSEKNFTVSKSAGFEFTGSDEVREFAVSTADTSTSSEPPAAPDVSLPVWLVAAYAVAAAGAATASVLLVMRLRSRLPHDGAP